MDATIACVFIMLYFEFGSGQATNYPYFYLKEEKGILCFDPDQSSMKMTVTGCCHSGARIFQNRNIYIGNETCYGAELHNKLRELKDGDDLKVVSKGPGCATFITNSNGFLQLNNTDLCVKEVEYTRKLKRCGNESSKYIFYNNGTCPTTKANSTLIKYVTKMQVGDNYFLTNDGSKLTLSPNTNDQRLTKLKLYSNNQLWAITNNQEYCLYVDEKEKLKDLEGLDIKLAKNEQGCKGQRFRYRSDLSTYELYLTNYCWNDEGSDLKLGTCDQRSFKETLGSILYSTSSYLSTTKSTATTKLVPKSPDKSLVTSHTQGTEYTSSLPLRVTNYKDVSNLRFSIIASKTQQSPTNKGFSTYSVHHTRSTISKSSNSYQYSTTVSYPIPVLNETPSPFTKLSTSKTQINTLNFEVLPSASSNILATPLVSDSKKIETVNHNLHLANPGQQCEDFCRSKNLYCSDRIDTGNSNIAFRSNGVKCKSGNSRRVWREAFDPSYNVKSNICSGYISVNETIQCHVNSFTDMNIRRLCKCVTSVGEDSFSLWAPWSDCSRSCDKGEKTRKRFCIEDTCIGKNIEVKPCNDHPCPVNGGFSQWSAWTNCSSACGGGRMNRSRACNNPLPKHGGLNCYGVTNMSRICNVNYCPIDGQWSAWTQWSACDKPCNNGSYRRWRYCTNPSPLFGGRKCEGDAEEKLSCNTEKCPSENITIVDIKFDIKWQNEMEIRGSKGFHNFENELTSNLSLLINDGMQDSLYIHGFIDYLRKGSVIATFTLSFAGIDSFQLLLLQDAIIGDKYIGKLKIISSNQTFLAAGVPSVVPTNFTATAVSSTSIEAAWNTVEQSNSTGNIRGYILFYREKLLRSMPYQSIATYNRSVTLRGLKTYSEYNLRVLAYNDKGNGLSSSSISVYTLESAPSMGPKSIKATADSPFSIIVAWSNLQQWQWNGKPLGYIVRYSDLYAHTGNQTVFFPERACTLQKLIPRTTYVIQVCAFTIGGTGPCQRVDATTLPSAPSKPPENITIDSLISHNSIDVSWKQPDNNYIHGDLKGYKIMYKLKKTSGKINFIGETKTIIVHPSLNEIKLTGLQPNSQYEVFALAFNEVGDGVISRGYLGDTCTCPEIIYTNFAASAPYVYRDSNGMMKGLIVDILQNMTSFACGICKRARQTSINFANNGKNYWAEKRSLKEMKKDIDNSVHASFPIFGNREVTSYNGNEFVPLFRHPGVIYYIIKDSLKAQVVAMIKNILNTWPIFLLNLLLIILSGIAIWALDANNQQDFAKPFIRGTGSGIYWAFITMGTHGYGDLTPKGIAARLHAIIWILIGIINLSILTGALTTALTAVTVYDNTLIYGVKVAAVHDSEAYRIGIHRNAKINTKEQYKSVEDVAKALKSRQVRGALVDVYTAASRSDLFKHPDIVAKKSIRYPNSFGLVLSGDMKNAATAFRSYMHENNDKFLGDFKNRTSKLEIDEKVVSKISLLNPGSESLRKALISLSVTLIITVLIGWSFHLCKMMRKANTISQLVIPSKEIEELCDENMGTLASSVKAKLDSLMDQHLEERVKLSKLKKGNGNTQRGRKPSNNYVCLRNKAALNLAVMEQSGSRLESITSC